MTVTAIVVTALPLLLMQENNPVWSTKSKQRLTVRLAGEDGLQVHAIDASIHPGQQDDTKVRLVKEEHHGVPHPQKDDLQAFMLDQAVLHIQGLQALE